MNYVWPAVLQALAFLVAMAEVIIPSFGLLSLLCAGLFIWSWVLIIDLPRSAAVWFGLADILLVPVLVKFAFSYLGRSPVSHRTHLGTGSGLETLDQSLTRHVGATVTVESALRPTGKIRIGDELFEAQAGGEFVETGSQVKIVSVSGSRFPVERA